MREVLILLRTSPNLLGEGTRIHDDVKRRAPPLAACMGLWGCLIILIVAGLDFRLGWSPPLSTWIQIIAIVFMILASFLTIWALAANKFFSGYVRIQRERGHTVANTGPYAFVRHPGYLGVLIFYVAMPVLLGSLWALLPAGFYLMVVA
ncbi:MAG: isoprenylcysteine carboxylmethyltransferase family protein [Anaerolineales bacterium]|nr:isoprenylcysteine carboxylmethyltransferase family protein [Anaerolineales bacterium]